MIYISIKKVDINPDKTKNKLDIGTLRLQIELLRKDLDNKIVSKDSLLEKEIYNISLQLDELIERYIDMVNDKNI